MFFESLHQAAAAGFKETKQAYGGVTLGINLLLWRGGSRHRLSAALPFAHLPETRGALCLKVAKQQPICRERLLEEA